MKIGESEKGLILNIKIKPKSREFKLDLEKSILYIKSSPFKGEANKEIIKGLKGIFGKEIEIIKGFKSREKLILIKDMSLEEFKRLKF